jgi:two-component system, OmpR family, response regulator RegX3
MQNGLPSTASVQDSILIFMKSEPFAQSLKKAFESNGYSSTTVATEAAAFAEVKASPHSLIIIDRQLGSAVNLRELRAMRSMPIVAVQDKAAACGDDECIQDYDRDIDLVVCSQTPRELVARVRAILRRRETRLDRSTHFSVGHLRMDLDRHEVTVKGRVVDLTPKEFKILYQFMESPSRVFSRQEMLNRVWGEGYALEEHALDVHVHSLRQKIEADPNNPKIIVTVRGIGYKLRT